MKDLKQVAQSAGEELTRKGIAPAQGRHVYAPVLVQLGLELLEASKIGLPELREDVLAFARKMSAVMNVKAVEKPGRAHTFLEALGELQYQLGKFQQIPGPSKQETERILVHISNYAMIAMKCLEHK